MASRPMVRGVALACVLVALVGGLAVVAAKDDGVPSAGARIIVDGRATLVRVDGSTETLSSGDIVRSGEEVRAEAGTFVLELADGGELEGRAGFDEAPNTRVIVGERPEVVAGEVLLLGREGLAVDADGTVVALTAADAAARVDRAIAVRAASYHGGARVDSAGVGREVPALRQLGIASLGRPAGSADPFVVDEEDPWDRRFLGGAISLDHLLDPWSDTFSRGNATVRRTATLYEEAVPAVVGEPAFAELLADVDREAGEVLIGTVLTTLSDGRDFESRWREVFGFRDEGAGWGLVALDQALDAETVVDAVAAALGRTGDIDASGVALAGSSPGDDLPGTTPPGGTGDGGGSEDDDERSANGEGGGTGTTTPIATLPPTTLPATPTVPPTTVPQTTVPQTTLPPPPTVPAPTVPPPEEAVPDTGIPLVDDALEPITDLLGGLLG